jgi:DNA (cytosine-5)-methyltransferase 1
MRFIDLFAGIGGFRLGMEQAGHECVGWVEWDKFARKSYEAIHDTEGEWTASDIRKVTDNDIRHFRGTVDVICGGFPCQPFSIAGRRLSFEDTRGTMFFEIARFAKQIKPRYLFLENVKGLLSADKGKVFDTILSTLDELGYDAEWQVLNSKNFGVPHNRERVFIIGVLRESGGRKIFPIRTIARPTPTPRTNGFKIINMTKQGYDFAGENDSINFAFPGSNTRRGRVGRGYFQTLDTQCTQAVNDNGRWRQITPKEAWRLQGFKDKSFEKAKSTGLSDGELYKQAGNSVTVNVIYQIAKRLGDVENGNAS